MSLFIIFFFGNLLRIGNLAHAKKMTNSMSTLNRGGGVEGVGAQHQGDSARAPLSDF